MTNATRRLSIASIAILVLFLSWAFVAARPWAVHASAAQDPRVQLLAQREARLRHDAVLVNHVVARRWKHYQVALHKRQRAIARAKATHAHQLVAARQAAASVAAAQVSAPSRSYSSGGSTATAAAPPVRIVTLPALTITRTS